MQETSTPSEKPLSVQASEQTTPLEIYSWINKHISYRADINPEDEFRPAAKTLALGYGDCDDMAVLADDLLKKQGYTSEVVAVYTSTEGHAICVWQDSNGKYNHLSNKNYREIQAPDVRSLATDVYTNWQTIVHYPDNSYEVRS